MVAFLKNSHIQYAVERNANSKHSDEFWMLMLWIFVIFFGAFLVAGLALLLFYQPWKRKQKPPLQKPVAIPPQPVGAAQQQIYNISTSGYASAPIQAPPPQLLQADAAQQQAVPTTITMPAPPTPTGGGAPRVPYLGMVPSPASQSYTLSPSLPPPPAKPLHPLKESSASSSTVAPDQDKVQTVALAPTEDEKPEGLQEKDGRFVETFPRKLIKKE